MALVTRPGLTTVELLSLTRRIAARPELWRPMLPPFGTWTRLSADAAADVWLVSWLPGGACELHDHGDSAAAFTVVEGRLDELRAYGEHSRLERIRLMAGSSRTVEAGCVHDVTNPGPRAAVSIHAYSPPLGSPAQS